MSLISLNKPVQSQSKVTAPKTSKAPTSGTTTSAAGPVDKVSLSGESEKTGGGFGGLLSGLMDNFGAGMGNAPTVTAKEQKKADANYAKHGNTSHNLTKPEEVKKLMQRSPQIDSDNTGTDDDAKRCGGASLFNGLLTDGNFAHNGAALGALASNTSENNPDFKVSEKQQQALQAMQMGKMTPNDAAQLQELTYDMTKARSGQSHEGLNKEEITSTVKALRQYGAFGNTEEINFRRGDLGGGAPHWTMSSKTRDGRTTYVDSNLNKKGQATVGGENKASFAPLAEAGNGSFFMDSVSVKPGGLFSGILGNDEISTRRMTDDGDFEQSVNGGAYQTIPDDKLY